MPRASRRRRRRRRSPGRGLGPTGLIGFAIACTVVVLVGSLLAIHTRSQGYRDATTRGYAALADQVGLASTRTGSQLSSLLGAAGALTDRAYPYTARNVLEQGLDSAVLDTSDQAAQAATVASPPAVGDLSPQFTAVMQLRASATARLRSTVDQLLGMQPLPIAGAPSTTTPGATATPATLISVEQAAAEMSAEGAAFVQSDAEFRALEATAAGLRAPFHLHPSVWVPTSTSPLGPVVLGSTATTLASSPALVPVHHLVVTAVGLNPPAVPTGGVGIVATTCAAPTSTTPGSAPTVLPPTSTVTALVTVTNCGTVPESGVTVTVAVSPADPAGSAPPPPGGGGGRSRATVALVPGASAAPVLAALPVSPAHRYTVTVSVSLPPGQSDPAGSTQQFLVQVVG